MKKEKHFDYVTGLLTGYFDEKGKFVPKTYNKFRPINEVINQSRKSPREVMIEEDLMPGVVDVNRDIFTKSEVEKQFLKRAKKDWKKNNKDKKLSNTFISFESLYYLINN